MSVTVICVFASC